MASLIKQHGRYYLQFYAANRKPKRKRVALLTENKRTATKRRCKLEGDYVTGEFDPWTMDAFEYDKPDRPTEAKTVQEAIDALVEQKKRDGCTNNTVRSYRCVLRLFANVAGKQTPLEAVSRDAIEQFIRNPSVSKSTRHKRYRHVKTFLRWCRREELLASDPLEKVTPPDKPKKLPKAITPQQLERICQSIRDDYVSRTHVRVGELLWYIPLFRFGFFTGMRASELGRLRWQDIDFDKGLIAIRKQKNKKEQTIPLNAKACEVLDGVEKGSRNDYVFKSPRITKTSRSIKCFRETASRAFKKYREEAEIDKPLSFHSLRHGFATALAEAGKSAVVIKEACRHADITTSMLYVHMTNEHLKAELDDVFGDE